MRYCNCKIFDSVNNSYGCSLDKVPYKVKNIVKGSSNKGGQWGLVTECIRYILETEIQKANSYISKEQKV
jgi:hypothetical protein